MKEQVYKDPRSAEHFARFSHHAPTWGGPPLQEPFEKPGRSTHRNASTLPLPVLVVGRVPAAALGGLHQMV